MFSAVTSSPTDRSSVALDFCADDFLDQYLTFNSPRSRSPDWSIVSDAIYMPCHFSDFPNPRNGAEQEPLQSEGQPRLLSRDTTLSHSVAGNIFYTELSGRAAISDSELLDLEGITFNTPQMSIDTPSLPSSPSPQNSMEKQRRKQHLVDPFLRSPEKASKIMDFSTSHSLVQNPPMSAKATYPQNSFHGSRDKDDTESTRLVMKLDDDSLPLLLPPSAKLSASSVVDTTNGGKVLDGCVYIQPLAPAYSAETGFVTPRDIPVKEESLSNMPNQRIPSQPRPEFGSHPPTPNSQYNWSRSPSFSTPYIPTTIHRSEIEDYARPQTPMTQPSPSSLVFNRNPQCASESLTTQLQNDIEYNGHNNEPNMMIDSLPLNSTPCDGLVIPMSPTIMPFDLHPAVDATYLSSRAYQRCPGQVHTRRYTEGSLAAASHIAARHGLAPSDNVAPPLSHSDLEPHTQSSDSPSNSPPSSQTPNHRTRSHSRPNSNNGSAFVNFTPNDSHKILTGVAPSGSSKTKARRDKEAAEKRRKLSQAAIKALRAAGGDFESLQALGLLP